jgi:D-serine deaminase-like pyridoxal phosphate-dependent protein/ribosomal protein S18 acetylase RimI-like enzyme
MQRETELQLRPATEADLPFLLELRRQTLSGYLRASGVPQSEAELEQRVRLRFECAQIVLFGTEPIGLFKVARDGGEWALLQIQIAPSHQGRGIGARLIRELLLDAQQAGAAVRLSVLRANPARRLYQRLGFRVVGEVPHSFYLLRGPEAPAPPRTLIAGDPVSALDTPALLVDLPAMERNIERLFASVRGSGVAVRPHLKTVKSPLLAQRLLAAGARGVCVAKLSEAEIMLAAGIEDVLITTELAGEVKLRRLAALLPRHGQLKLVVDGVRGADALERALAPGDQRAEVLIDLDVGQHRCGVLPGEPALELARHVAQLPHLRIVGVQGYEGHLQQLPDPEARARACEASMQLLTDTARGLRAAGHRIEIVTTGGTGTAEICARHPGVTEIQPGSFVFLDTSYRSIVGARYECALSVLATVLSRPRPGEAVVDAGLKSLSTDSGFAAAKDLPGVSYRPAGDEHGILSWDPASGIALDVGERVELLPSHIDTTINLHDIYYARRGGPLEASVIEAIWPVMARGRVQ